MAIRDYGSPFDGGRKTLLARGATEKHVKSTHGEATRLCKACRFYKTTDLAPSRVERYLGELRIKGRSARTRNSYLQSIKQFSKWLVDDRRAPDNPLACLRRANEAVDKRRTRRALTSDEFAKLLDSASHGPVVEGMKGRDRAVLYLVAAFTGLRRKEMGSPTRFPHNSPTKATPGERSNDARNLTKQKKWRTTHLPNHGLHSRPESRTVAAKSTEGIAIDTGSQKALARSDTPAMVPPVVPSRLSRLGADRHALAQSAKMGKTRGE